MTTEWQREGATDPRFDLTEVEVERLKFLTAVLTGLTDHSVGAVRAYVDGQPVCVLVLYEPSAGSADAVDMKPLAVLMDEVLFDLITPPPMEGEDE